MLAQTVYRPYYTKSAALVNYMIRMLAGRPGMRVLEPCAGDGVLIEALLENIPGSKVDAYELDPDAFIFLKKKYQYTDNLQIKHADAIVDDELTLLSKLGGSYDRIIANPHYGGW